jgi:uncharacterized protein YcaQ
MVDKPQAHGYRWAFHPREDFKYQIHREKGREKGLSKKTNLWEAIKDVIERRDKEHLTMSGSYSHKLCLYCSYGVILWRHT